MKPYTVERVIAIGDPIFGLLVLAGGAHRVIDGVNGNGVHLAGDPPHVRHVPGTLPIIGRTTRTRNDYASFD